MREAASFSNHGLLHINQSSVRKERNLQESHLESHLFSCKSVNRSLSAEDQTSESGSGGGLLQVRPKMKNASMRNEISIKHRVAF